VPVHLARDLAGASRIIRTMAPSHRKSGYLPGFDGWRALAILGVIMAHDKMWHVLGHTNVNFRGYGGYGVYLFFAISGILICWRILEDEAALGTFHLRSFYIRRLFRIQPAAWAYLFTIAALILLGIVHERWHFWLGAFFLYQNFLWHGSRMHQMLQGGWFTGHFWTLAVEEHFYILLSLFLFFCRRHRIAVLGFTLLCFMAWQHWAKDHHYFSLDHSERRTYWALPYLLFPALCAMLLRVPEIYRAASRFLHPWVAFALTALALAANQIHESGRGSVFQWYTLAQSEEVLLFCFSFWVVATMLHPRAWTTRLLETAPLRYLGRLSYSIYLWHLLFFSVTEPDPHITWRPLVAAGQQPWRYVSALAMAMLSYHLLEKPMIRLGHKLAPPASPGHADLQVTPLDATATAQTGAAADPLQLYPVSK